MSAFRRVSYDRPADTNYGESARQTIRGYCVGNARRENRQLELATKIGWEVDFQVLDLKFAANDFPMFVDGLRGNIQSL